jgi:hypothetical protein
VACHHWQAIVERYDRRSAERGSETTVATAGSDRL